MNPRKLDMKSPGYEGPKGQEMGSRGKGGRKAQFNIRVDEDLLEAFRKFCDQNGLDPQAQIVHFMRRVVDAEVDLQDKLWEALRGSR